MKIEGGFARVPNDILVNLSIADFNGVQFKIVLFILRLTFGYNKDSAEMSQSYIAKGIESDKDVIKRELKKLIARKVVIIVSPAGFHTPQKLKINPHCEEWALKGLEGTNQSPVDQSVHRGPKSMVRGDQLDPSRGDQSVPQLNTISKDNNKEIHVQMFKKFYSEYPKKQKRAEAEKAFLELKPDDELFATMLKSLEAQKQSDNWKLENGKYIPLPSNWIKDKRWEDEIEPKSSKYVAYDIDLFDEMLNTKD